MPNDSDTRILFRPTTPSSAHSPASPTSTPAAPSRPSTVDSAEPEPRKLELSATQLVGGALAAMTAAALGSRLGLAGTVVGAALASLVAGVGGALYTASLRRTRETVRTVWRGRPAPTSDQPAWAEPAGSANAETSQYPGVASAVQPRPLISGDEPTGPPRRRLWPRVVAGTLASFALAGGVLTSVELLTGHALSGGSGTTIDQVRRGQTSPTKEKKPSEAPTSKPSATPSETPSSSPSSTPSNAPSDAPSSAAPTSPAPSSQPSSPSATPSTQTPSAAAEPSS